MKINDSEFVIFLSKFHKSLQDSIETAIDFLRPDMNALDEDFLKELENFNPDVFKIIKAGIELQKDMPKEEIKILFLNQQNQSLEFIIDSEEDIIIYEGDYDTEKDILIGSSKIAIINGNLSCRNIIVNDAYLFVNGNVYCNVLFGASGNDKMTHISLNVNAKSIVENGHYTLAEGAINTDNIIMLHNEISSNSKVEASIIFESGAKNKEKLHKSITDDEGSFDEIKFLDVIDTTNSYKFFE
jgi:hypothetical protein